MADVVTAVLAVAVLGGVGAALLAALTVVPFVVALQGADRRGLSSGRSGALAATTSLLGPLLAVLLAVRTSAPLPLAVLPLLLVLAGPAVVSAAPGWLGRRGRHEARAA